MSSATASSYFAAFARFLPDPAALLEDEFARLARSQRWSPRSKRYKDERRNFLMSEYDHHVGYIGTANGVSQWQDLCRELGIDDPPETITRCKKATTRIPFVT